MPLMIVTTVHSYTRTKLAETMQAVAAEGNRVAADGYLMVGYQVVESEKQVVVLYRRVTRPKDAADSSLTGE